MAREEEMEEKKKEERKDFMDKNKELIVDRIEHTKEGVLLYVKGQVYCISHGC